MLHCWRTVDRRVLGLLLVAVFLFVVLAGFAHIGQHHDPGETPGCGLCLALIQIALALPVVAAWLVARAALARRGAPVAVAVPVARRHARPPPARGPPSPL